MNQVFLKDFEDFLNHRLEYTRRKLQKILVIMEENQAGHEKRFVYKVFYKKFGWTTFRDFEYNLFDSMMWEKDSLEDHIESIQVKLAKLSYNRKAMEVMMCQDIDIQLVDLEYGNGDTFYNWAKANNRPY